jgi:hypothetical protein
MLKKFVQVDQAGAEALIVAYCCRPGNYRKLFDCGIKVHSYIGMHVFASRWPRKMLEEHLISDVADLPVKEMCELPIEQLPHHPKWKELASLIKSSDDWPASERYYFIAKQICHSSNYSVGPYMYRMNTLDKSEGKVVIEEAEAVRSLSTYHGLFPEIRGYHRWIDEQVDANSILYNLHGHPYQITHYEILDKHRKELYSWIPQSTVGEITNIAYARMYSFLQVGQRGGQAIHPSVTEALDLFFVGKRSFIGMVDLLANTHDSYLTQTHPDYDIETAKVMKFFIEQSFTSPIDGIKFSMKSEAQSGFNWSPYKKCKNEQGLREIKL